MAEIAIDNNLNSSYRFFLNSNLGISFLIRLVNIFLTQMKNRAGFLIRRTYKVKLIM